MDFVVRYGTEEDMPEMLRLWREMMDFHAQVEPRFRPLPAPDGEASWEEHMRENVLGHEGWCVLVAESEGRLVGQLMGFLRQTIPVFNTGSCTAQVHAGSGIYQFPGKGKSIKRHPDEIVPRGKLRKNDFMRSSLTLSQPDCGHFASIAGI